MLSGMSRGAGIVITGKSDTVLKHVEFIRLGPEKALAILWAKTTRWKTASSNCRRASPPRS